jgi:L-seryl-tRNA(Ser) seleniumtransferase
MTGFVDEPPMAELAKLAKEKGISFVDDCGSGCLFNTEALGLPHEPTLVESLASGADIVTASGDKLLGGPQAGMLLGKTSAIERVRKHPLARALRIDKLTAVALEATLRIYLDDDLSEIPTYRALARPLEEIERTAVDVLAMTGCAGSVEDGLCEPGGGSLPGVTLPSKRIRIDIERPKEFSEKMRLGKVAVIGYIEKGEFWLDMRTVEATDVEPLVEAVRTAVGVA